MEGEEAVEDGRERLKEEGEEEKRKWEKQRGERWEVTGPGMVKCRRMWRR